MRRWVTDADIWRELAILHVHRFAPLQTDEDAE